MSRDPNTCARVLEELFTALDVRGELARPLDADLAVHLDVCQDCAPRWERIRRQARALSALEPRRAPNDLEGRVVAALNAGHRQERAIRALAALTRLQVPRVLEGELRSAESIGSASPDSGRPGGSESGRAGSDRSRGEPRAEESALDGALGPFDTEERDAADRTSSNELRAVTEALSEDLGALQRQTAPDELRRRLERDFARGTIRPMAAAGEASPPDLGGPGFRAEIRLSGTERRWVVTSLFSMLLAVVVLALVRPKHEAGADRVANLDSPSGSVLAAERDAIDPVSPSADAEASAEAQARPGERRYARVATNTSSADERPERARRRTLADFPFQIRRIEHIDEADVDPGTASMLRAFVGGI